MEGLRVIRIIIEEVTNRVLTKFSKDGKNEKDSEENVFQLITLFNPIISFFDFMCDTILNQKERVSLYETQLFIIVYQQLQKVYKKVEELDMLYDVFAEQKRTKFDIEKGMMDILWHVMLQHLDPGGLRARVYTYIYIFVHNIYIYIYIYIYMDIFVWQIQTVTVRARERVDICYSM
jgi:hypothetical protein